MGGVGSVIVLVLVFAPIVAMMAGIAGLDQRRWVREQLAAACDGRLGLPVGTRVIERTIRLRRGWVTLDACLETPYGHHFWLEARSPLLADTKPTVRLRGVNYRLQRAAALKLKPEARKAA